jgi:ankyrin repeat protein
MEIHDYAASCDLEGVKKCLLLGQDANSLNHDGQSIFHILASKAISDPTPIAEYIIESCRNIDINQYNREGISPLHLSCLHRNKNMVNFLIKTNANLNIYDINNRQVS